jgi:hypothetical protein
MWCSMFHFWTHLPSSFDCCLSRQGRLLPGTRAHFLSCAKPMSFAAIAPGKSRPLLLHCSHLLPSNLANSGHNLLPWSGNSDFYHAAAIHFHCARPIPATFAALQPFPAIAPRQSWPLLLCCGHLLPSCPVNPSHFYCTAAICCHRAWPIPATICCPALGNADFYCATAICCHCACPIPATVLCPALENSNFIAL